MKPWYIFIAVALIAVIFIFTYKGCKQPPTVNEQEKQLQVLQQKFDSLAIEINAYKDSLKRYDTAITLLKLRDSELTGKLEYNKGLQKQLKTEYAKADHFANYNSNDITRYFADSLDN